MLEILVGTRDQIFDRSLENAIDNFTKYTHENRYGVPGWKTNCGHLLGKKIIVDGMVEPEWSGDGFKLIYGYRQDKVEDITKVLCWLTGKDYSKMPGLHGFFNDVGYRRSKLPKWERGKPYAIGDAVLNSRNDLYVSTIAENTNEPPHSSWTRPRVLRNTWYSWGFFEFKVYKKGTMHLKFKSLQDWEVLNRNYARIKGQVLPEKI